jgi:hypothetical protein
MEILITIIVIILILITLFQIINKVLVIRSKKHSNKFVDNLINRLTLNNILSVKRQGWKIQTFKTTKDIIDLNIDDIPLKKGFSIKDPNCSGVADPFLIKKENIYYLFFEYEYHKHLNKGADIAYAISKNGLDWQFEKKIITERFHQSFPYVFKESETYYMIPESYQSNKVILYKASVFPSDWIKDTVLYEGKPLVDTIFVKKDGYFFWFTTDVDTNELLLFYSNGLKDKWKKHPSSPITKSLRKSRNAGPILSENNKTYRVSQDCEESYGSGINIYEIETLSIDFYKEKMVKEPLFYRNIGIYKDAIHHLNYINDSQEKIIAMDVANFAVKGIKFK